MIAFFASDIMKYFRTSRRVIGFARAGGSRFNSTCKPSKSLFKRGTFSNLSDKSRLKLKIGAGSGIVASMFLFPEYYFKLTYWTQRVFAGMTMLKFKNYSCDDLYDLRRQFNEDQRQIFLCQISHGSSNIDTIENNKHIFDISKANEATRNRLEEKVGIKRFYNDVKHIKVLKKSYYKKMLRKYLHSDYDVENIVGNIPDHFFDDEMIKLCLKFTGIIKKFPKKYQTLTFIQKELEFYKPIWSKQDRRDLVKSINFDVMDYETSIYALKVDPEGFEYIDPKFKDANLCELAIKLRPENWNKLPEEFQTSENLKIVINKGYGPRINDKIMPLLDDEVALSYLDKKFDYACSKIPKSILANVYKKYNENIGYKRIFKFSDFSNGWFRKTKWYILKKDDGEIIVTNAQIFKDCEEYKPNVDDMLLLENKKICGCDHEFSAYKVF